MSLGNKVDFLISGPKCTCHKVAPLFMETPISITSNTEIYSTEFLLSSLFSYGVKLDAKESIINFVCSQISNSFS